MSLALKCHDEELKKRGVFMKRSFTRAFCVSICMLSLACAKKDKSKSDEAQIMALSLAAGLEKARA